MKTTQISLAAFFLMVWTVLGAASSARAHSEHTRSVVPVQWIFAEPVLNKIENRMEETNPTARVGLSRFERESLEKYGLRNGHRFHSEVLGRNVLVERTTMGLTVTDSLPVQRVADGRQLPIAKIPAVVPSGFEKRSHAGHDHRALPVQWTFSSSVQMKMLDRFRAGLSADLVGLPLREQMRLTRYGIRVGNIFTTPLHFTKLWVERTSAGIRILFVDQDRAGLGRSLVAVQSGFRR